MVALPRRRSSCRSPRVVPALPSHELSSPLEGNTAGTAPPLRCQTARASRCPPRSGKLSLTPLAAQFPRARWRPLPCTRWEFAGAHKAHRVLRPEATRQVATHSAIEWPPCLLDRRDGRELTDRADDVPNSCGKCELEATSKSPSVLTGEPHDLRQGGGEMIGDDRSTSTRHSNSIAESSALPYRAQNTASVVQNVG
eukprot:scaffold1248_cov122-Isochrysis_galbana.AAC.3